MKAAALALYFLATFAALGACWLAGCAPQQQLATAQGQIEALCTLVVPLAPLYPPVGVYATAACATDAAIAKVAASPTGLAWLTQIYAELRAMVP